MEHELETARRTLSAILQGQPVSEGEITYAINCLERCTHHVQHMRRHLEDLGKHLQPADVYAAILEPSASGPRAASIMIRNKPF